MLIAARWDLPHTHTDNIIPAELMMLKRKRRQPSPSLPSLVWQIANKVANCVANYLASLPACRVANKIAFYSNFCMNLKVLQLYLRVCVSVCATHCRWPRRTEGSVKLSLVNCGELNVNIRRKFIVCSL